MDITETAILYSSTKGSFVESICEGSSVERSSSRSASPPRICCCFPCFFSRKRSQKTSRGTGGGLPAWRNSPSQRSTLSTWFATARASFPPNCHGWRGETGFPVPPRPLRQVLVPATTHEATVHHGRQQQRRHRIELLGEAEDDSDR